MNAEKRKGKTPGGKGHVIRYQRNSKTISGRLQDELVVMDIDQGKYFNLNSVATRIWDLLEESMAPDDLCRLLMDEYGIEPEQCKNEVGEYLVEMVRLGLISEVEWPEI